MLHRTNQKGFTLIELLIVISIIGILATIATVSLGASQQRARDAQRKSDLKQVANALEVYFQNSGTGGSYPTANAGRMSDATSGIVTWGSTWPNYMRVVPTDPLGSPTYCYINPTTTTYTLYAKLENSNDPDRSGPYTCNGVATYNYQLQNPF